MTFDVSNESELPKVVKDLWPILSANNIVLFHGDLGAGKTTLVKQIGKHLGVTSSMSSPSFSLVNQYETADDILYHIDLYRIKDVAEIYEFGLPEILDSGKICLVEWPEMAEEIWHDYDCSDVSITIEKSMSRRIFVK